MTQDYAAALESATKAVEIRPSKDAYLNRSIAFRALNQPIQALEDADKAFAIDSSDGKAGFNRSIALCMMNRVEESFAAFDDSVKQCAEPSVFINEFYDVLVADGTKKVSVQRLQEAVQILDKAVSLRPDLSSAYAWRATAKLDQQLLDDALADSETALRITPGMPLAHFIRGIVRLQSGSFEESVADLTVAINGDFSTSPLAYQFRGLALQQLGRGEEAARDLATFQQLQQATQAAPAP